MPAALGGLLVADILRRVLLSRDMSHDQAILIGMVIGLISTMVIIITFDKIQSLMRAAGFCPIQCRNCHRSGNINHRSKFEGLNQVGVINIALVFKLNIGNNMLSTT